MISSCPAKVKCPRQNGNIPYYLGVNLTVCNNVAVKFNFELTSSNVQYAIRFCVYYKKNTISIKYTSKNDTYSLRASGYMEEIFGMWIEACVHLTLHLQVHHNHNSSTVGV